ncbi:MAG: glycosyltransferase family 2 protein [Patescibacteria group bacterium]|nr:glycosyltransferase family 2 protein [Patescibacteria group bacterium]
MEASKQFISIVIPVFNEEGNVEKLHKEIIDVISTHDLEAEIIFVDDGSTDKTLEKLRLLSPVKVIVLRKNFKQTAAMDAGIKVARGKVIITMDGDLQNDPADIPRLLQKLDDGYDVVSGWRKNRKDSLSKMILSRGADQLRKLLINDTINDSGCTLKAYRAECFKGVDLYGEIHRFIPALLKIQGFEITEIAVNHRPRVSGVTKYNYRRLLKGLLDLLSVWFWKKYANRPLHLFGGIGIILNFIGFGLLVWMFIDKVIYNLPIGNRVWPLMGIFLIILGIQFFISGLLVDISVKTYYQTKKETPYSIKEIIKND